jgi:hypothetical protein
MFLGQILRLTIYRYERNGSLAISLAGDMVHPGQLRVIVHLEEFGH